MGRVSFGVGLGSFENSCGLGLLVGVIFGFNYFGMFEG